MAGSFCDKLEEQNVKKTNIKCKYIYFPIFYSSLDIINIKEYKVLKLRAYGNAKVIKQSCGNIIHLVSKRFGLTFLIKMNAGPQPKPCRFYLRQN